MRQCLFLVCAHSTHKKHTQNTLARCKGKPRRLLPVGPFDTLFSCFEARHLWKGTETLFHVSGKSFVVLRQEEEACVELANCIQILV